LGFLWALGSVQGKLLWSHPTQCGAVQANENREDTITKVRANTSALNHRCVVMLLHSTIGLEKLDPVPKQADDVVRGDDPGEALLVIDHGKGNKVVLIEHLSYVFV
jgi:hypothetical protein